MIPLQCLALEENNGEDRENGNRDDLLDDLELHQRKGSAVADEAHTVCRHLTSVLEERQEPTDKDNEGYPIGIQLMGNHFEENKIIKIAYAYEQMEDYNEKI